jgi:RNA polymerase sigma factor (sigma-70 family)
MNADERAMTAVVTAAQAGDEQALDDLVTRYLPLVYNLVGRALGGHGDVDDVVQETMLRALAGIGGLREPARFRSWLVTIAMRQINDRWQARRAGPVPLSALGPARELPDPAADFVNVTITRLGLSGERREVAEATAWLDADDRRLLSLWWLETAGELTRAELTAALGVSPAYAAVRIQRMKSQLAVARGVVRALAQRPRCGQLSETIAAWDGSASALWRKRIARHTRNCQSCARHVGRLTPAEALLAGIGMIPPPVMAAAHPMVTFGARTAAHQAPAAAAKAAGTAGRGVGRLAKITKLLTAKPAAAIGAGVVAAGGAGIAYTVYPPSTPHTVISTPARQRSITSSAEPTSASSISLAPPPTKTQAQALVYGSVVDAVDAAPPRLQKPRVLPVRPAGAPIAATGEYEQTNGTGPYQLKYRGDYLVLHGQGYFRIRWQIATTAGRIGQIAMPTWTGLTGKVFHVASGGSRRMDDPTGGSGSTTSTGMGSSSTGFDTVPAGAQQMWQNEYYYLDGTVVLHQNQGWAAAGFLVQAATWQQITDDVDTAPGSARLRYGLVRDSGDDTAPVPQYVTRGNPSDPANVAQRSDVS